MNSQLKQQNKEKERVVFAVGNEALRKGNYREAIQLYSKIIAKQSKWQKYLPANLSIARQKYHFNRRSNERYNVGVCGWDLAHNAAGRVYTLASLYERFANTEMIGSIFPAHGHDIWEPIRGTSIVKNTFVVEDESKFIEQAIQFVAEYPYDIVHLSKPRIPNIIMGVIYKLLWNSKVFMDIDDEELAFVDADTAISIDDYLKRNGSLPSLKNLDGKDWTRIAVGLAKEFDGITVSNSALQKRYGGEIIRHARDDKLFKPSPELKVKSRKKYGISQDKKVVLFFGTPREYKGLIETALAISELNDREIIFFIVGTFPDPHLKKRLLEIEGCNYKFLPNQPINQACEILATADCCLLLQDISSTAAQFQTPAKLSDALSLGKTVLASRTQGLEEYFSCNALIEVSSSNLKDKIEQALKSGKETCENYGIKAFNDLFSITECTKILKYFLRENTVVKKKWNISLFSYLLFTENNFDYNLLNTLSCIRSIDDYTENKLSNYVSKKPDDVDIVVPVYNSLDDVKICLNSIENNTDNFNVRIIVINDGSDEQTTAWLRKKCQSKHHMYDLIEHQENLGYTKSVNAGLKVSRANFVITQNSDTIVSSGWLKGMIRCMKSDQKIGIVGPLSNAASWQNVPKLYDKGGFAVNDLPDGIDVEKMATVVARASLRTYPRLPFINGFCFMIRRNLLDTIGFMDEENFPIGYGEENDFCIRAIDSEFELAIADDVFVFHAKSKSFGHERRKQLCKEGTEKLIQKHGEEKYSERVQKIKNTDSLDLVRNRIEKTLLTFNSANSVDLMSMRILFILPVKGGSGGAHSVVQEVTEMRRLGIFVRIAMKNEQLAGFRKIYADIPGSEDTFLGFDDFSLLYLAQNFDVVVGTIFNSMQLVKRIVDVFPHILPAYYIQDYEPWFFDERSKNWYEARDSYTLIPNALLFAKTHWIIDKVGRNHDLKCRKVQPSIDHSVYKPFSQRHTSLSLPCAGQLKIIAMIRPKTPRRGAGRTMRILARLHKALGDRVALHIFGSESEEEEFLRLERNFPFINHGVLLRSQVATLLGESDLFIDLSDYQAFGRTALEAMACGCATVVPAKGGTDEYAVHGKNSLVVDTSDEEATFNAVLNLINNSDEIIRFKREGLNTAANYSVHAAAISECLVIEKALKNWRKVKPLNDINKKSITLLPDLGGNVETVAGVSGYRRILLPYNSPNMFKYFSIIKGKTLPKPGDADVAIIQRDADKFSFSNIKSWLYSWKNGGGKLVYEIDDDLLNIKDPVLLSSKEDARDIMNKVRLLAKEADLILVPSERLKELFIPINSNVHVIPNCIDTNLWQLGRNRDHSSGPYRRHPGHHVLIGYVSTASKYADLDMITEAMKIIEMNYRGRVKIEVIGGFQKRAAKFGKRVGLPKKRDYLSFVRWLQERVHWDIGLIPLVNNDANRYKSCQKFLECAALDMALVVSNVSNYSPVARHGYNCLLARSTTEDWVKRVSQLIEDEELRKRLSCQARKEVKTKMTTESIIPNLRFQLDSL